MKENLKNEKGITLISLVITIIVLIIIAGVTLGASGIKGNIQTAKNNVAISELSEVQQAVLETYVKYKQTENEAYLVGTKLTYSQTETYLKELDTNLTLKQEDYDTQENVTEEKPYYQLSKDELESIGIKNTDDIYIVNYETGEVFNYTSKTTDGGEILYIDSE